MSIHDTTNSTGQADQLDKQPTDKAQDNISKQFKLLLSSFAQLKESNAELKETLNAIFKIMLTLKKRSAPPINKRPSSREKYSPIFQLRQKDLTLPLSFSLETSPQARSPTTTPQIEAITDEVNTSPHAGPPELKFETAFQPSPKPHASTYGHVKTKCHWDNRTQTNQPCETKSHI